MQELEITSLEKLHGFEDAIFRNYISGEDRSRTFLKEMSANVGEGDHPLVRGAAGWAAVELAVGRNAGKVEQNGLDYRLEMLDQAKTHWYGASKDLAALGKTQWGEKAFRTKVQEMRFIHDLAYLPLMEVAASWLAGRRYNEKKWRAGAQKVRSTVLGVSALALGVRYSSSEESSLRADLMSKISFGLLAMGGECQNHLLLPGSLRREYHPNPLRRANYAAIAVHEPHPKTTVQLKSGTRPAGATDQYAVAFYRKSDLTTDHLPGTAAVLDAFGRWDNEKASAADISSLWSLSRGIHERLDFYHNKRLAAKKPDGPN